MTRRREVLPAGWVEDEIGQVFDETGAFRAGRRPLVGSDPTDELREAAVHLGRAVDAIGAVHALWRPPVIVVTALSHWEAAVRRCPPFADALFHVDGAYDWAHTVRQRFERLIGRVTIAAHADPDPYRDEINRSDASDMKRHVEDLISDDQPWRAGWLAGIEERRLQALRGNPGHEYRARS